MLHVQPPKDITSFHPPRRILLGPGPSDIHPRVIAALGQTVVGYLGPSFVGMMEELKTLLRYAFQTTKPLTLPVSGPGSVGFGLMGYSCREENVLGALRALEKVLPQHGLAG